MPAQDRPSGPATAETRAGSTWLSSVLRVPLFYKLVIANGAIALLAVLVCATLVANAIRANPQAGMAGVIWPIALSAVGVGVLVNALVVRLALTPLRNLVATAEQVRNGSDTARAAASPVSDAAIERVVRTFNDMLDSVSAYRRRLREIAIRAVDAGEMERKRVSKELHDGIAQSLAATLVQIRLIRASADPHCSDNLQVVSDQLAAVIDELRVLAQDLRPPALDMIGLTAAILAHARNVSDVAGVKVDVAAVAVDGVLSKESELTLYRLVQEALLNVVRHSGSGEARIELTRTSSHVTATVIDRGRGFDVSSAMAAGALGLFGMQERAHYVRGTVTIESSMETGTTVRITIPVEDAQHV